MRKHNLAFIDIETTGLSVLKHEIIEIGCILATPDLVIIGEFELKINHYDKDDWIFAYTLPEALKIFSKKTKDAIMVGQNVSFDSGFLEYAFAKTKIENSMHYHKLDTISIVWAKLHRSPDLEHFSLREMCVRFGIKNEHSHTALADARATYELYKKLMEL